MDKLTEALMRTGLTQHEALLYQLLCTEGRLSGYEAAKLSGISRSNVYTALAGLADKGGADRIDGTVVKFVPVQPDEFCKNKLRSYEESLEYIKTHLDIKKSPSNVYLTIRGRQNILDKAVNMLDNTSQRVYISCSGELVKSLDEALNRVVGRGLKLVVLSDADCKIPGARCYHSEAQTGQIGLISDSHSVLTGELGDSDDSAALYTDNPTLVDLFKKYLKNEIELLELKGGKSQ